MQDKLQNKLQDQENQPITIQSRMGDYTVDRHTPTDTGYRELFTRCRVAVIDRRVHQLYGDDADTFGKLEHIILQDAVEEQKTADTALALCSKLLETGFKRGETLLAVGGGIIQDLVTFTASILFRGVPWIYIPTTLLAQADSCIGGKSSINLGRWKNQLGNFYPPRHISIAPHFLKTLTDTDTRSGLGEILKVHLLSGVAMAENMRDFLFNHPENAAYFDRAVFRALSEKAAIIREDEFDTGKRLTLNFGHTFGHALETASDFAVAHGIAVAFGVDMAAYIAMKLGRIDANAFQYMHDMVDKVITDEDKTHLAENLDTEAYIAALRHDKKNTADHYCFILPRAIGTVEKVFVSMNREVENHIFQYFRDILGVNP